MLKLCWSLLLIKYLKVCIVSHQFLVLIRLNSTLSLCRRTHAISYCRRSCIALHLKQGVTASDRPPGSHGIRSRKFSGFGWNSHSLKNEQTNEPANEKEQIINKKNKNLELGSQCCDKYKINTLLSWYQVETTSNASKHSKIGISTVEHIYHTQI